MKNEGFSLIELIVVIAIMAVLVAVIAPRLNQYLNKSKQRIDETSMKEIEKVMQDNLGLAGVSVMEPDDSDLGVWIDILPGTAFYDSTAQDTGDLMAYSKAVAFGIGKVPHPKTRGMTKFQAKITKKADGSYLVEVQMV